MITPDQKNQLKLLVEYSRILTKEHRSNILDVFDSLPDEQLEELQLILSKEKNIIETVDKKYLVEQMPIQQGYLQAIESFRKSTVKNAFKIWEKAHAEQSEKETEQLLVKAENQNESQEKSSSMPPKKQSFLSGWLVFGVIIFIVFILYFFRIL